MTDQTQSILAEVCTAPHLADVPYATVHHGRKPMKQFTKLVRFRRDISKGPATRKVKKTMKAMKAMKGGRRLRNRAVDMPAALQQQLASRPGSSKDTLASVAGTQAVEGEFGNVKELMARMNLDGAHTVQRPHVNFLAAAHLLRSSGPLAVARALRVFREGVQDQTDPGRVWKDESFLNASV